MVIVVRGGCGLVGVGEPLNVVEPKYTRNTQIEIELSRVWCTVGLVLIGIQYGRLRYLLSCGKQACIVILGAADAGT